MAPKQKPVLLLLDAKDAKPNAGADAASVFKYWPG
jgi:hypothetical protein